MKREIQFHVIQSVKKRLIIYAIASNLSRVLSKFSKSKFNEKTLLLLLRDHSIEITFNSCLVLKAIIIIQKTIESIIIRLNLVVIQSQVIIWNK